MAGTAPEHGAASRAPSMSAAECGDQAESRFVSAPAQPLFCHAPYRCAACSTQPAASFGAWWQARYQLPLGSLNTCLLRIIVSRWHQQDHGAIVVLRIDVWHREVKRMDYHGAARLDQWRRAAGWRGGGELGDVELVAASVVACTRSGLQRKRILTASRALRDDAGDTSEAALAWAPTLAVWVQRSWASARDVSHQETRDAKQSGRHAGTRWASLGMCCVHGRERLPSGAPGRGGEDPRCIT